MKNIGSIVPIETPALVTLGQSLKRRSSYATLQLVMHLIIEIANINVGEAMDIQDTILK